MDAGGEETESLLSAASKRPDAAEYTQRIGERKREVSERERARHPHGAG